MLDRYLEEDDPIPLFRECDYCDDLYPVEDGYSSLRNAKAACCSEACAESYDKQYEDDE